MKKEELDNKINQVLSGWDAPAIKSKKVIWNEIKGQMEDKVEPAISINRWKWIAAASVFVVAISFGAFYTSQIEVVSASQTTNFTLPDGSTVNLNTQSKAAYNSIAWLFNRSVTLSGEAFFTVKKGEKFSVQTEQGSITVLGTSFNVIARERKFKVECFTGKVAVNNGENNTVITKGEVVTQSKNLALVKESILNNKLSPNWVTGEYSYKNEQLATVLSDISNQFGININANNKINKLSFTGAWNKTMTLEEVLKIVCLPFNLEANATNDKAYDLVSVKN